MSNDHNPESYRLLFGLLGGALLALVLVFILASLLVAPGWVVLGLVIAWLVAAIVSWRQWRSRPWMPLAIATVMAVVWIAALTVGDLAEG